VEGIAEWKAMEVMGGRQGARVLVGTASDGAWERVFIGHVHFKFFFAGSSFLNRRA
jgi:hypothetical protein